MLTGKFIKECKNRFLCLVEINGNIEECYVSSSSKLENYIDLTGCNVLLKKNVGKKLRTDYTLHAAYYKRAWVLLNLNYINELVHTEYLKTTGIDTAGIIRECFIGEYKSDLYLPEKEKIVEAKGILSGDDIAKFPLVSCGRALKQMEEIENILDEGFKVDYTFVLMNPKIQSIALNSEQKQFVEVFKACIDKGLVPRYYTVRWRQGKSFLSTAKNVYIK